MTDREHVSELLGAFVDDSLEPERRNEVEGHLATCEECRRELTGLQALQESDEGLTELERTRLHRDVLTELGLAGAQSRRPSPRWAGAGRLVGVAATLVLLLGGLVYLGGNLGGDDAGDGDTAQSALEDGAGREDPFSSDAGGEAEGADSSAGTTMEAGAASGPPPEATYEEDLGKVTDKQLKQTGRRARTFRSFASVPVETVGEYRKPFLDELVAMADGEVAEQLRDCARDVLAQLPTAVATYAAPAEYGDPPKPVLILGFAYSFTEDGFLDQYQMWIYPRGTCDFPTNYVGGQIRP